MKSRSDGFAHWGKDGGGWLGQCIVRVHATHPEVPPREAARLAEMLRDDQPVGSRSCQKLPKSSTTVLFLPFSPILTLKIS
jgi:hypothetical protein